MLRKKTFKNNIKAENQITKNLLFKIKKNKFTLIAADYDGTLYDRYDKKYNSLLKVIQLAHKITKKGLNFAFISGRNTTLEIELRELIPKFCSKKKVDLSLWHSGGNGMSLNKISYRYKTNSLKVEKIFSNSISINIIKKIIEIYTKLKIKPDSKARLFFKEYLNKKIPEDLMPKNYFELSNKHDGRVFAELVKVSLVLPSSILKQKQIIKDLRKDLSGLGLNVGWGGIPFADISKELISNHKIIDGKLLMVKNIIKYLKIKDTQVVTFGDTPNDNNKGLLSLPYSFTNDVSLIKSKDVPPYILEVKGSSVKAVFDAINYLIK